jgi:hypothetical protein
MKSHLRDGGDRTVDRFEGGSLLLPGRKHDQTRRAFKAQYGGRRGAMLTVNDRKLATLDRGDHDGNGRDRRVFAVGTLIIVFMQPLEPPGKPAGARRAGAFMYTPTS